MTETASNSTAVSASTATPVAARLLATGKELVGLAAALGAVLFLVLSIMYDRFYGPLGLEPEDVGLTRASIIARSAAGIIVIAASGIACLLVIGALQFSRYVMLLVFEKVIGRMSAARPEVFTSLRANKWLRRISIITVVPGISKVPNPLRTRRSVVATITVLAATTALVLTFFVGWPRVQEAARAAGAGHSVAPLTFLGLRVLDVSSTPCTATWLSDGTPPAALIDPNLHCLGEANGNIMFRTPTETVRVPSSLVFTTFG